MKGPSKKSLERIDKFADAYAKKSGTFFHMDKSIPDAVKGGLAVNMDDLGKPLCPCRAYPDKKEEVKHRTWICPCDDMQIYKYCHCILFVNKDSKPVTEYLPPDHEGRKIWGVVKDDTPDKGRAMRHRAAEREEARKSRPS